MPTPNQPASNTNKLLNPTSTQEQSVTDPVEINRNQAQTNVDIATVNEEIANTLLNLSSLNAQPGNSATQPCMPTTQPGSPVSTSGDTNHTTQPSLTEALALVQPTLDNVRSSLENISEALKLMGVSANQSATNTPVAVLSQMPATGAQMIQASSAQDVQKAMASSLEAQRLISLFQVPGLPQIPASLVATEQTPLLNLAQSSPLDGIQEVVTSIVPIITGIIGILGLF